MSSWCHMVLIKKSYNLNKYVFICFQTIKCLAQAVEEVWPMNIMNKTRLK